MDPTKHGRITIAMTIFLFQLYDTIQLSPEERAAKPVALKSFDHTAGGTKACVEFSTSNMAVLENEKKVRIGIKRSGRLDCECKVQ